MGQRIVITGLGVLSPIGSGIPTFWQALLAGQVGTGRIEAFDTSMFDLHIGGEVRDVDPANAFRVLDPAVCGRTTQLAVAAAWQAVTDAQVLQAGYDPERVGICMGTTTGNASIFEDVNNYRIHQGPRPSAALISHYGETYITAAIAQELGAEGPCHVIPTACAAGNYAIGWGMDMIRDGLIDVALVGGSDALSRGCFTVFHRLGGIAHDVCQPFDRHRTGMLVSEGAGVLVLEDYERARARGARIYAELLGYGLACDAYHPTAPHPDGLGAQASMHSALREAQLAPAAVSYISAHGTGTRANDSSESLAVRKVFASRADEIPVSSIKSMLGHTMGAASAIEAITCALAISEGIIPPTANYREPDPECLHNVVPNQALVCPVEVAMSNAFAFGGNIATIVMRRHA